MNKKVWVICIYETPHYVVDTKEEAIAFIKNNILPNYCYNKEIEDRVLETLKVDESYENLSIYEVKKGE